MACVLRIDNYIIDTPLSTIVQRLRLVLTNGKLRDVIIKANAENIVVTCPNNAHAGGHEASPACNIYIGDNANIEYGLARCFVCGFTASFVQFVAECFDKSEDFAKHWLIANFGIAAGTKISLGDDIVLNKKSDIDYLDEHVLDNYQTWCPYMSQRKLTRETCERFKLRYDPYYREILFPCFDESGRLVTILKRKIDTKSFYIDQNIAKPLYCFNEICKAGVPKAVVTEGLFDTLLGNQYGMPTFGTLGMPSDDQIARINKSCLKLLYLMFDNDAAGHHFNEIFHKKITPRILLVDIWIPSPYKDIGDLDQETFKACFKNY